MTYRDSDFMILYANLPSTVCCAIFSCLENYCYGCLNAVLEVRTSFLSVVDIHSLDHLI